MRWALIAIILAGCSANSSPALEPVGMEDALQVAEPRARGLRLVEIEGFEWADSAAMREARLERHDDLGNATMRTADRAVGDGRAYAWSFLFADDDAHALTRIVVDPSAVRYEAKANVSAQFLAMAYPTPLTPLADLGDRIAAVGDEVFDDLVMRGADGRISTYVPFDVPHYYYHLKLGTESHTWWFDEDGDFLGRDEFTPAGLGYIGNAIFIEMTPLTPETLSFPIMGRHDELVVTLHSFASGSSSAGHVFTLTATSPEGETFQTTLDVGLDESAYSILRIPEPEPGQWDWEVRMDRGLLGDAMITLCAAGRWASDDLAACRHV